MKCAKADDLVKDAFAKEDWDLAATRSSEGDLRAALGKATPPEDQASAETCYSDPKR